MIERPIYLKKLIDRKQNGLIKIITGVRRCGKSVLLFDLFFRHLISKGILDRQIIRIQLDNSDFASLRNPLKLSEYIKSKISEDQDYFIFIDEIQLVKKVKNRDVEGDHITFYDVLNGLLAKKNLDIYVTGSNSKMLSKDVLTEFRGRGDEVKVYPLSFREFYSAKGGSKEDSLKEYMLYGGMPFILSRPSAESKISYLKNLFEETYLKDIVERNRIRDQELLGSLIDEICSATGSLTNSTKLANTINSRYQNRKDNKVNNNTVASYLSHLENAFLFKEAKRYDIRGKQYFNSNSKFYCVDVGLRNVRLNMRQNEETHIMENIVFNDLVQRGYSVDVGVLESFSKGANGKTVRSTREIDFVVNYGNAQCYIQSAYRMDTPEKERAELLPFNIVGNSFKKIVITRNGLSPWYDDNGIYHIGLCDFLLKESILE
ncbi:ATP-binding protein [uncultured Fibrobacter sp.]|uniref:ATP-binding protein n=1 Tax=uncultured Fibrobacter sp. TaxID=261512 RepID=UPI0025CF1592|nr:ATP-binding protein [uncultured Fibrobacter sp.]